MLWSSALSLFSEKKETFPTGNSSLQWPEISSLLHHSELYLFSKEMNVSRPKKDAMRGASRPAGSGEASDRVGRQHPIKPIIEFTFNPLQK